MIRIVNKVEALVGSNIKEFGESYIILPNNIQIHKKYNPVQKNDDIALLKTDHIKFSGKYCLLVITLFNFAKFKIILE